MVAEGDFIMIHGRYVRWAAKQMVAVKFLRVLSGKVVGHYDATREETPRSETGSPNPMF